ncbi:MAG: response regulator [Chloroflexi bacterium]|nr:response regulator [Chloroflexota bacterium]MBI3763499.1 response regulator [Chloroflexota bacterium]
MRRVLIVDDEIETVRMLALALELFGFEPMEALSGAEALRQIENRVPDAVVLDLMMPDMDGLQVIRRIRADPKSAALPIIVVTAMVDRDAEEGCRQAGAAHFLRKPVKIEDLASLLQSATGG